MKGYLISRVTYPHFEFVKRQKYLSRFRAVATNLDFAETKRWTISFFCATTFYQVEIDVTTHGAVL
jgi:hypothetical protein